MKETIYLSNSLKWLLKSVTPNSDTKFTAATHGLAYVSISVKHVMYINSSNR